MNIIGKNVQSKNRVNRQLLTRLKSAKSKRGSKGSAPGQPNKNGDRIQLSGRISDFFTPLKNLTKTTLISAGVAAGLGALGCVGGLPLVAVAALGGAIAGGSIRPACFPATNAFGTACSFATAAAIGAAGPVGIGVAGIYGAGATIMASLMTGQQEFG